MPKNNTLSDRMKEYEFASGSVLTRRVPVVIRVDGRAFSGFCKRFKKPYDKDFHDMLNTVMVEMCANIQGVKFAERHSDEISFIVTDFDKPTTDAFFDYGVQKVVSIAASMATSLFCRELAKKSFSFFGETKKIITMQDQWPMFDARCFNIPENEIANYVWWRLSDAKRNSISMQAQARFSHKELQGKNSDEMQEMLFSKFGINWGKLPQGEKIGYCCMRTVQESVIPKGPYKGQMGVRMAWTAVPSPSSLEALRGIINSIEFRSAKEDKEKSNES